MSTVLRAASGWVALALSVTLLAGCKGDEKKRKKRSRDKAERDLVAQFEEAAETVCRCKDAACAENAMEPLRKLSDESRDAKATRQEFKSVDAASERAQACLKAVSKSKLVREFEAAADAACACA